MKPISIQKPTGRNIGQWIATIQLKGESYTLPVLHASKFNGRRYDDPMKMADGSGIRGVRYQEHIDALQDIKNNGLIIVQNTKSDNKGTRHNAGYVGVFKAEELTFRDSGYSLVRGVQIAMFAK